MEFKIQGKFRNNTYNLMRNIGYHFVGKDEKTGEINFVKPVGGDAFPRFHVFLRQKVETGELFLDLHLDQKAPIYRGVAAHSGEYSGQAVEGEADRIKHLLKYESIG